MDSPKYAKAVVQLTLALVHGESEGIERAAGFESTGLYFRMFFLGDLFGGLLGRGQPFFAVGTEKVNGEGVRTKDRLGVGVNDLFRGHGVSVAVQREPSLQRAQSPLGDDTVFGFA